jgi:iron(III) transport system permease protein
LLVFYSYVYMMARASFKRQKISMIEVGRLLGASPIRVFFKISLPLARPAGIKNQHKGQNNCPRT